MNLRQIFLFIIILNAIVVLFFLSFKNPSPPTKKSNEPFLQKLDTKTIFGRRKNITPIKPITINPKIIKPIKKKGSKQKSKNDEEFLTNPLKTLGLYTKLQEKYFNDDPNLKSSYHVYNMGLINEADYCDRADRFILNNPKQILGQMNFLTDYNADGLARLLVMKVLGNDVMADEISKDMSKKLWNSRTFKIPQITTSIFTKKVKFHYFHEYNKNLFCNFQIYNHVPGHGALTRKDLNVESVNNYVKRFENMPQCFDNKTFFPPSFRLDNSSECTHFFNYINSEEYKEIKKLESMPFITKVSYGSHRGHGLEILDDFHEKRIRRKYENGKMCGQIIDNVLAQRYISRPLLIDQHKFDFRIYMLIASTDPLIVYYHDGFLRMSLLKYDINSKEKSVHFTNTNLAKDIFKHADEYYNITGLNETELRSFQMWSMEKLQSYLLEKGKIKNDKWLDEYLRPEFQKAFVHTVMMSEHAYLRKSNVFEIFGLDFILDENLKLWFIECNASPVFQGTSPEKELFQTTMLKDMFEIEYAYLRSRYKRVRNWSQKYNDSLKKGKVNEQEMKKEFYKINQNKLEKEFTIKANNTFTKIIDMSESDKKKAFNNMFDEECFNNNFK